MILRHKRIWIPAAAGLVMGVVLLGNHLVRSSAESKIAKTVACGLKSSGPTSAHLTGPWAGLGILSGDLGTVNVSAEQVRLGDTSVNVTATLHHVTTSAKTTGGKASTTIAYAQLQRRLSAELGTDLQLTGDGHNLVIDTTFGIPVTVDATLTTAPQAVTITPTQVGVLGQKYSVPALLRSPLSAMLPKNTLQPRIIPLSGLPAGINLTTATPTAGSLRLAFDLTPDVVTPACVR